MFSSSRIRIPVWLLMAGMLLCLGCSGDEITTPEEFGTVMITPLPTSIIIPWTLTGPSSFTATGNSDSTLTNISVGDYTIAWGEVADWIAPPDSTQTLTASATVIFSAVYEAKRGAVEIDTAPDSLEVPWILDGPLNYSAIGNGDSILINLVVGEYVVNWNDLQGWIAPEDETLVLTEGDTLTFEGSYLPDTGTIVIAPLPAGIEAPWTLTRSPDFSVSGSGDSTLTEMVAGTYTVTWEGFEDWITPDPQTFPLTTNAELTFSGEYQTLPTETGTVVIDPSPDSVNAPWELTGIGNHHSTGNGNATIIDLPIGEYTLTWGDISGWVTPVSETAVLAEDATLTFVSVYTNFAPIPSGSFTMGQSGVGDDEAPAHFVSLADTFYMQISEISNQQYMDLAKWAVDNGHATVTTSTLQDALDGSTAELLDLDSEHCEIEFSGGTFQIRDVGHGLNPDHPVKCVTWYGAVAYCDWLSLQADLPRAYDHATWACNGNDPYAAAGYRLPTEAEWEYACRAGENTAFNTGTCLEAGTEANYNGHFPYDDCPAGPFAGWTVSIRSYPPNGWSLYEMHGNVFEWCNDRYSSTYYDVSPSSDPVGPLTGSTRVIRSGTWYYTAANCRSAYRGYYYPALGSVSIGFRPVGPKPPIR